MSFPELESLKKEFLNRFAQNEINLDVLKKHKRVLKHFKELIQGSGSLQKIISATGGISSNGSGSFSLNSTQTTSTSISGSSSSHQNSATKSQHKSSVSLSGSSSFDVNQDSVNQMRFLQIAASEEISKLIRSLLQPHSIVKTCLASFETDVSNTSSNSTTVLKNLINQEFLQLEKRITVILKNYQESLPFDVVNSLQELRCYYLKEMERYLNLSHEDIEKEKNQRYTSISAPFIGHYQVSEASVAYLYERSSISIDRIRIQRVGTEFVHLFQKYLITYVMNKVLLDSDIFAGLVICLKDSKKKKTFFFLQYSDHQVMEDIDQAYQSDQSIQVALSKNNNVATPEEKQVISVNMNSFLKQICASFLSMNYESFIPNYGICGETGNIYRHQLNTSNEDRTAHAGIKNPLYFFKESLMIEKKYRADLEECLDLKRCNIENLMLAVSVLDSFARSDFKFELKKGRKHNSLFLSKDHITGLQCIVKAFTSTLTWLEEAVFSIRSRVCLLQIINKISPLVIEFSMRIMSKSTQEHMEFMKKISIEDFLLKVATKKYLKKYILLNKMFEEDTTAVTYTTSTDQKQQLPPGIVSATTQNLTQSILYSNTLNQLPAQPITLTSQSSQKNNSGNTTTTTTTATANQTQNQGQSQMQVQQPIISHSTTTSGLTNSPLLTIANSSIQILAYLMDLNLLNFSITDRRTILTIAAEKLLFIPMIISIEHIQQILSKFHKSWSSVQVWGEAYSDQAKFTGYNIFVELLSVILNVPVFALNSNEPFKNLSSFDDSNEYLCKLLQKYFKFPSVKGDKRFKLGKSILEYAIVLKKFKVASLLIDCGEGMNIQKQIVFDSLDNLDGNENTLESKTKLEYAQELNEFNLKLQQLIYTYHPTWINEYNWEKMWRTQFHPNNADSTSLSVYTHEYGKRSLPKNIWTQMFSFRKEEQEVEIDPDFQLEIEGDNSMEEVKEKQRITVQQIPPDHLRTPERRTHQNSSPLNNQQIEMQMKEDIQSNEMQQENEDEGVNKNNNKSKEGITMKQDCENDLESEEKYNKTLRLSPFSPSCGGVEILGKEPVLLEFKDRMWTAGIDNYMIENEIDRFQKCSTPSSSSSSSSSNLTGAGFSAKRLALIRGEDIELVVEEGPNYPGNRYVIDSFIRLFSDIARPKSILVRINNSDYLFTQVLRGGISLSNVIQAGKQIPKLDKCSLGDRLMMSMIIGQSYTGLSDEILEANPLNAKEYRLMNISNSQAFVIPMTKHNSVNCLMNVRNVLFCMDQMHDTIDPHVFLKYRSILPDVLLEYWFSDLISAKERIAEVQQVTADNPMFRISHEKNMQDNQQQQPKTYGKGGAFLFSKAMIKTLYERLFRITKFLKKAIPDDQIVYSNNSISSTASLPKYSDIFESVNPLLAHMYKRVNVLKGLPIQARFEMIEGNMDRLKSFVTSDLPTFVSHFSQEKLPVEQSLEEVIANFKSIGPLSCKLLVQSLAKLSRKDTQSWEDTFSHLTKDSQIKTVLSNGYLENDWNDATSMERVVHSLTMFQQKPVQELKHLLQHLILDNMECVTLKSIRSVLNERITTLSLRGCSKIVDSDVVKISETLHHLTFLDLSKNPNLLKLNHSNTSKFSHSKPILFPNLKTLILEDCASLVICDIEGIHLQNINLSSCVNLQHLFTTTPNLKRIALNQCSALQEEYSYLYIIEGTQCMLDDVTSNGMFKQTLLYMELNNHTKMHVYKAFTQGIFGRLFVKMKSLADINPLMLALNRRGLNKNNAPASKESSGFFGFSKKPSTSSISEQNIRNCRMSIIHLLLKNPHIRELKFLNICEDLRDFNITSLLKALADKLTELASNTSEKQLIGIDTIDLSDIKLSESNMKSLGEIVAAINANSSTGLSIFLQSTQESQNQGFKYFCSGLKNQVNKLDLSKNRLGKEQLSEICKMVVDLGSGYKNALNHLSLKNCRIDNELIGLVGAAIKQNTTLRYLDLSDNFFDHDGLKVFIPSIYDNTTLATLTLDGNSLKGEGFSFIKNARFLKRLDLQQCGLEEKELSHLCTLISENQSLNILDLSYNKLNMKATLNLVQSIKKAACIRELTIRRVFFEEESVSNVSRIAEILTETSSLQTLDLSCNSIQSEGLIQIGRALSTNTSLRVLLLNEDQTIGLRGIVNLANLIQSNHSLQALEIQGVESCSDGQLAAFKSAWDVIVEKIRANNQIRVSKKHQTQQFRFNTNPLLQLHKKFSTSPTHRSIDQSQSSFFGFGQEKLDSHRIKVVSDHFKLGLSIDGGGMRGIIPATIIQYICQCNYSSFAEEIITSLTLERMFLCKIIQIETKREVHEIFDVVGGTSIGGILALSLTCTHDGKTPIARGSELPSFFEENGNSIFNSSKMVALWNNLRDKSKYDPAGIEAVLRKYFQNCKLSDVIKGTNVIATAMKREQIQGKNQAKIFRSKEAMFADEKNFLVRDIGRATSAAPMYFPSAEIKNIQGTKKYSLIDGALGQNNPSKLVLDDIKTEALNSGNEKNFFLLSIGTGTAITTQQISQNAGLFNLLPIINSLGEGALAFLDRDIEKSADGMYLRVNPEIPIKKNEAELDNTEPKIVEIYKQCATEVAEKLIGQDLKYGPFNDQNLLDWLAENTAKKKDTYI